MALTPAEKQRRYRQRQSRSIGLYRVPAGDSLLIALLRAGRLTEAQACDRVKVEAAISEVVNEWVRLWVK